jgi:hypothetical protein
VLRFVVVPSPSCPFVFPPQQYAMPLAIAHALEPPAEIEVTPLRATSTGGKKIEFVPSPS